MKDFWHMGLAILGAFVLYTIIGKTFPPLLLLVNIFSLVVLYFALEKGEITGACLGAVCGLIQDSFSMGVFGVAGIAKTILGYVAGYVSGKISVTVFIRNFIFIFILISLELVIWSSLYSFVFSQKIGAGDGLIFFQPVVTAFVGSIIYYWLRKKKKETSS